MVGCLWGKSMVGCFCGKSMVGCFYVKSMVGCLHGKSMVGCLCVNTNVGCLCGKSMVGCLCGKSMVGCLCMNSIVGCICLKRMATLIYEKNSKEICLDFYDWKDYVKHCGKFYLNCTLNLNCRNHWPQFESCLESPSDHDTTCIKLDLVESEKVFSMKVIHVEPPFSCDYVRNGYCKRVITSTAESKRVF